jgi:hypothetical protein
MGPRLSQTKPPPPYSTHSTHARAFAQNLRLGGVGVARRGFTRPARASPSGLGVGAARKAFGVAGAGKQTRSGAATRSKRRGRRKQNRRIESMSRRTSAPRVSKPTDSCYFPTLDPNREPLDMRVPLDARTPNAALTPCQWK